MQDIIQTVKMAVGTRWLDVLSRYFDPAILSDRRKEHPCPKCGGETRFGLFKDFDSSGGVTCRKCFTNGADGIAAVAWILGCSQIDAANRIAADLGIDLQSARQVVQMDVIDVICRAKRMPREGLEKFGPLEATKYGREKIDVIKLPVYNEYGENHSHFFISGVGKGYCARGRGNDGLFLPLAKFVETQSDTKAGSPPTPRALSELGTDWLITEGVKDAAALVSIGYERVCGIPTSFLAAKYAPLFRGCDVLFVPDLDMPSVRGAQRTGGHLARIAKSVRVARLPGELLDSKGDGVREVLASKGADAVRAALAAAEPWTPRLGNSDARPEIMVTLNEGEVCEMVVDRLRELGHGSPWLPIRIRDDVAIYQRGGMLCQTLEVDSDLDINEATGGGTATVSKGLRRIRVIPEPILRERITQACRLMEDRSTGEEVKFAPIAPPKWLTSAIHCRGYYGSVRRLDGCVDTPIIRMDGTVCETPGYDERSRLLYQPRCEFPPIGTTLSDAVKAANELEEVVSDFPFKQQADRSAWLALLLTLVGRNTIAGCTPLFAVSANIRGAGKTILINAAHLIAKGSCIAARNYEVDDREMKKAITSIVLEAVPAVMLDNIDRKFGGPSLDAVLTSTVWTDRILGESRTTGDLPLRTVWTATGNNLTYRGDLGRRVLPIEIVTPDEAPENREGFSHPDLFAWIAKNRPRLAVASLTILRAYMTAGAPHQGGTWGSYEGWYRVIRNAIVWIGMEDPMLTRRSITESDDSAATLRLILAGLNEADPYRRGLTAREIGELVESTDAGKCPSLAEASSAVCSNGRFNPKQFAAVLRQFRGRVVRGESIHCTNTHGGVKRWSVHVEGQPIPTDHETSSVAGDESESAEQTYLGF